MKRWIHPVLAALLGAVLASCGGAGDTGGGLAEGGIGGTGISRGSVTGFGSIVVNGRHFDVESAEITLNGQTIGTQDDLDVGYVVRVDGGLDDGIADSVRFDADLIGPVGDTSGIPAGSEVGTFTVMQQTVRVTATTVLAGVDSASEIQGSDTAAPDHVLVSGYRNSDSVLVATHVDVTPPAVMDTDQVVARVQDETATGFELVPSPGGSDPLTVESGERPDTGDRVRVRGTYDADSGTPVFRADAVGGVETLPDPVAAGAEIELEGIVTEFDPDTPARFTVDGVAVDAGDATIVDEAGKPAGDRIARDVEVEVEGKFDGSTRTLVAERVVVELEDNVRLEAPLLTAPDLGADTVSFFDQSSTTMVTAQLTDRTRLRDDSSADDGVFSLDELAQGEWVELEAFEDETTGEVIALRLERFDPDIDQEVRVEGIVDEVHEFEERLEILGVRFDVSVLSGEHLGTALTLDDIQPGDIVEVRWTGDGRILDDPQPVDKVELEDDRTQP